MNPSRCSTPFFSKDFTFVRPDPTPFFFFLFPPMIEMIAFGYALDNDVKQMATIVYDEDRTQESRDLVQRLVNTETFRVVAEVRSAQEMAAEIRKGRAYIGVQIPPRFTRDLHAGRTATVQ